MKVNRNMNCRPPNLASMPTPNTKYGVYICGTLWENGTRSEIKYRIEEITPRPLLSPNFAAALNCHGIAAKDDIGASINEDRLTGDVSVLFTRKPRQ